MRNVLVFVFLLFGIFELNAQITINGIVKDATSGIAIVGVHIRIIDKEDFCISDRDGKFQLTYKDTAQIKIELSHISYAKKKMEINPSHNKTLIILLEPAVINMNPVIITASKSENRILDVPVKAHYISSGQISIDPGKSLDDVLQQTSGIYVNRNFGILSAKSSVSARGLSSKDQSRMLVLVDGVPVNKTDGGGVNWNLFNKMTVESMEVMKGPGSALYGNNAMAGVINIKTKKPEKMFQAAIGTEYGTFNTAIGRMNVMGRNSQNKNKGLYYMFSALWSNSDGYITYPENLRTDYTVKTFMKEMGSLSKIGYDFDENNSIEFNFTYYDDKHGAGEKVFEEDGAYSKYNTFRYAFTYKGKKNKSNWLMNAYWLDENYGKINESLKDQSYQLYEVKSLRRDFGFIANYNYLINKNNTLTTGLDMRQGSVDAADIYYTSTDKVVNQGKMDFFALYIQDELKLLETRLHIQIGARFDYASYHDGVFVIENPSQSISYLSIYQIKEIKENNWNSISPRIAAQYEITETIRTYLSYSLGFRPPVLDDMCRSGKISGGFKVVNPELKPEHIQTIEWGWKLNLKDNISVTPALWYSLGSDFMYYVSTGDSAYTTGFWSPVLKSMNISKVQLYGFELDINWKATNNLDVFGNYAFTQNKILEYKLDQNSKLTDLTGKHLTDVPQNQFMLGGNWRNKFVNSMITFRYVGSQWVNDANIPDTKYGLPEKYDAYTLTDIKLWRNIGSHINVGFSILNVFDKVYLTSKSQLNPGRMFFGELKILF